MLLRHAETQLSPLNVRELTCSNKKVYSTRAPSSGAITLSALKIFEGFDGSAQPGAPGYNETLQRLIEANKFAYGQRATFGDPAFTPNVTELERAYLTEEVAAEARAKIVSGETFPVGYYNPSNYYTTRENGTSHLATVDGNGMAVSLTTTVNLIWGSQVSECRLSLIVTVPISPFPHLSVWQRSWLKRSDG